MSTFDPTGLVFETYLEAHREAVRRNTGSASVGTIHKVAECPYGDGWVIRSCPAGLLASTMIGGLIRGKKPAYSDVGRYSY